MHYPLQQLLTVLALESARSACLVVGEDLGVVPDEMRQAMPEFGLYHYKVLLFEKMEGRFRRPDEFVRRALATATTHDMPTLRSYWEGRDIELRRRLNLYPSAEIESDVIREREHDRRIAAGGAAGAGAQSRASGAPLEPFTAELAQALHLYLARSATALVALQIEDLLGMTDPVNVPGTITSIRTGNARSRPISRTWRQRADMAARLEDDRARGAGLTTRVRRRRLRLSARGPDPHEAADQHGHGQNFDGLLQREGIRERADDQWRERIAEQ